MRHHKQPEDPGARRMLILVAAVILVVAVVLGLITRDRWRTSPSGGDLAPITSNAPPPPPKSH